jgi:hypothetical protein
MNHATKSMWEMVCRDRDLQAIKAEKRQVTGTMNAKINNVIYMELYSEAKMVDKYEKMNVAGSIDREFTVYALYYVLAKLVKCSVVDGNMCQF